MDQTTRDDPLLTVKDLVKRWDVDRETIYSWNRRGTGPVFIRVGTRIRYRLSDVLAYEAARASGGEPA